MSDVELDQRVRWQVYDVAMRSGTPPLADDVASKLAISTAEVRKSFERLASAHMLVLQPDGEILMANPFSAVPTPFLVESESYSAYGNCIWDALGIPAMLGRGATISCSCGDCGAAMQVRVVNGVPEGDGLMHFAIPARHWWDDIVFN